MDLKGVILLGDGIGRRQFDWVSGKRSMFTFEYLVVIWYLPIRNRIQSIIETDLLKVGTGISYSYWVGFYRNLSSDS